MDEIAKCGEDENAQRGAVGRAENCAGVHAGAGGKKRGVAGGRAAFSGPQIAGEKGSSAWRGPSGRRWAAAAALGDALARFVCLESLGSRLRELSSVFLVLVE